MNAFEAGACWGIEKRASRGALIGAGLGAGAMGLAGGLKEWDAHARESLMNLSPKEKDRLFKDRLKRIAAGMAAGTAAGAVAGYSGSKLFKRGKSHLRSARDSAAKEYRSAADYKASKAVSTVDELKRRIEKAIRDNR